MHYVTERWLGGMLTNFRTVRSRLQRLDELEALQQSPQWDTGYSKKMQSTLSRELRKIRRNLDGVRRMTRMPAVLVAVDVRKESNALREARKLGIPTVCLIDTDSDPDMVSIAIPGNDDAMRAINLVMSKLADAVELGIKGRPEPRPDAAPVDPGTQPRRRVRRAAPTDRAVGAQGSIAQPAHDAPAPAKPVPAAVGAGGQPDSDADSETDTD
jgi:small subunit ribosomal protein S2